MGAGGIIQHHAEVLVHAVGHSSIYDMLDTDEKNQYEVIRSKAHLQRNQADVDFLKGLIAKYC